jgi:hypothetical protein
MAASMTSDNGLPDFNSEAGVYYRAMLEFVWRYYSVEGTTLDGFYVDSSILGRGTVDPGMWSDWIESIEYARAGNPPHDFPKHIAPWSIGK